MPLPLSLVEDFPDSHHARWGLGTRILDINTSLALRKIAGGAPPPPGAGTVAFDQCTHPFYDGNIEDWKKWRYVYESGELFIEQYLHKMLRREIGLDFRRRRDMTPIPAFATAAIDEVKNSIFERLADIQRLDGSTSYQSAVNGDLGGIDLKGSSLNWFLGQYILPELLVQKRVGIYVDSPQSGPTVADAAGKHPYIYAYKAENFRNWAYSTDPNSPSEFAAVLLRDFDYDVDPDTGLPVREIEKFRLLYIAPDGYVHVRFYDPTRDLYGDELTLRITQIPYINLELTTSLMKNVANHQIALLNMESSDVNYAINANFPFYVEQFDPKTQNPYLKNAQDAYRAEFSSGTGTTVDSVTRPPVSPPQAPAAIADVGPNVGRRYPIGAEPPRFINPSPDPLKVSMEKQQNLKNDIRLLVHLALSTVQAKAISAASKKVEQSGPESGLAYIGLELEQAERKLARYWAMYEKSKPATVNYPKRWSLKTPEEIIKEIDQLKTLRDDLPSPTFKKEMNIKIAELALGTHASPETINKIKTELANSKGYTSDPKIIAEDLNGGLVSQAVASNLRGYPDDQVDAAAQDHAERLARITLAQTANQIPKVAAAAANKLDSNLENPAARGIPDLSTDPSQAAAAEKIGKPGRGEAQ